MSARVAGSLVVVLAVLAGAPAGAHERGDRALGMVERVSAEQIVIRAADGHSVPFALTPETRFFRGNTPARREDVQVGQRAVVEGRAAGERIEAVRVRLGVTERK